MAKNKRKLWCIFVVWSCLLVFMVTNLRAQHPFDPVTEVSHYNIYAFKVDDIWADSVKLVTTNWERFSLNDTIEVHWMQPKSKTSESQIKPYFCPHIDTLGVTIENDISLYRYISTGDDSVVFRPVSLEGATPGLWEWTVTTTDTFGNTSQYAVPFNCIIEDAQYPLAPVQFKLIIRR